MIQTETAGYLATDLRYRKPIFTMWLTHSSWILLWPLQLVFLRIRKRHVPFGRFWSHHIAHVKSTARQIIVARGLDEEPVRYVVKVCLFLFMILNMGGGSWYVAVNLTTPSDLTAIYNSNAFFAYVFSIPILREPFRVDKMISVIMAVLGVVVVAYTGSTAKAGEGDYPFRAVGNIVIGAGAIFYGLYEVLYKRIACPPQHVSARRQVVFANVIGSCLGFCTLTCVWPILPILHFTGIEQFELPHGEEIWVLTVSLLANMIFSGSFLILMALTSPVLSSVAAILTTFLVPIVDWILFGSGISAGEVGGGIIIIAAFILLSYASWLELQEDDDDESDADN